MGEIDYKLTESELAEFYCEQGVLQQIWEANKEEFEEARQLMGIRSTQIMALLAYQIINSRNGQESNVL